MNPGLEGVVAAQTRISLVDGQQGLLVYRGYWARELAIQHSFEAVSFLLWHGRLPDEHELAQFQQQFVQARALDEAALALLLHTSPSLDTMSALRTVISGMGHTVAAWPPTVEDALRFTALAPTIIAAHYRRQQGLPQIAPHEQLDHVANYLYMLTGTLPSETHVRAMTAYLVLTMEHGMNASTFAARVVLSTQSDIVSALCGAIGAMKGPLHGGAPSEVIAMLDDIGSKENTEPWIRTRLEQGERLMGFGHRIYKTRDPRAEALKIVVRELAADDPWLDLADHVEQTAIGLLAHYKPGRKLYTNVEFFAAAVLRAVDMPASLFTPTFTASRLVGWTAHLLEQAENNRIFRPQSVYTGPLPDIDQPVIVGSTHD